MDQNHDVITDAINKSISVKQMLLSDQQLIQSLSDLASAICASLKNGGKVIFCGNGGSFADAQHLSAEFTSRFMFDRPSLPSLALGTNSSSMSAIANDYGYEHVFARELSSIAGEDDVFIGISTSGKSPNVVRALELSMEMQIYSALLTGNNACIAPQFPTANVIQIPSGDTAMIQESHIMIGHILCGLAEAELFGDNGE